MSRKLRPEIKEKWVAALRSGDYQQGQHYLARRGGAPEPMYCCLGVLCDLAAHEGVTTASEPAGTDGVVAFGYGRVMPPTAVATWAYEQSDDPSWVAWRVNGDELSELNDSGHTFEQIANRIEAGL